MAVSATIEASPPFVIGTNVGLYLASAFPGPGPQPGLAPPVAASQTVTVDSAGKLTFPGLVALTPYVAGALVGGAWRYIRFTSDEEASVPGTTLAVSQLVSAINGQSTAAGEGAAEALQALPLSGERAVHTSNTAFGWHALKALTGLTGVFAPTAPTAEGATQINLTGVEGKAGGIWAGGTSNTPAVLFRKVSAGVTSPAVNVPYFVVGGTANAMKLALTSGGAPIAVAGGVLGVDSEIALLASAEDNTAIGSQAGKSLTTGGGNTLVGENAGVNLTSGEETTIVGCEAGQGATTASSFVAIGFRTLNQNNAGGNVGVGTQALEQTTAGENVGVGHKAGQSLTTGAKNVAIGFQALTAAKTSKLSVVIGNNAGKALTSGGENTIVGGQAGQSLTAGEENVLVGISAGSALTGSNNVFIGPHAGQGLVAVNNQLVIANNSTLPLIAGTMSSVAATQELGFYGVVPVKQAAAIASPAETLAALKTAVDALRLTVKGVGLTA